MPILAILAPLLQFFVREIFIKFVILTAVFALMAIFVPIAVGYIAPHIGTGGLNSAFSAITPGMWFFLDVFALDYGLPLLISAAVAKFLIRRLPVIG